MNIQTVIVALLTVGAVLYFGRGFLKALLGRGGCATSGGACGSCSSGGCNVKRFEDLAKQQAGASAGITPS
jgi:hypothetical protein